MRDQKEEVQKEQHDKQIHPAEEKASNTRSQYDQDNNMNREEIQDRVGQNSYKNADNEGKEN
ncbi:hypothetical protein [Paenisporosarcina indica]|uniref:hypothetical protein n=1 Tax=Paenisporosarcina indica TaxID=650093 RepID=UPI00094F6AE9|nr:hypothetical protein [Paenisporosarcina indica]